MEAGLEIPRERERERSRSQKPTKDQPAQPLSGRYLSCMETHTHTPRQRGAVRRQHDDLMSGRPNASSKKPQGTGYPNSLRHISGQRVERSFVDCPPYSTLGQDVQYRSVGRRADWI